MWLRPTPGETEVHGPAPAAWGTECRVDMKHLSPQDVCPQKVSCGLFDREVPAQTPPSDVQEHSELARALPSGESGGHTASVNRVFSTRANVCRLHRGRCGRHDSLPVPCKGSPLKSSSSMSGYRRDLRCQSRGSSHYNNLCVEA